MRNINAIDKNDRTTLHYADNIENMQTLLNHGANVNFGDDEGRIALHIAASNSDGSAIVKLLLNHGVV